MIEYDVQDWDTIELIAKKYDVSYDTIMWGNNFWTGHLVEEGEKITFPPVTWVVYKVKQWETISEIAKRYSVDSEKIITQNLLWDNPIQPGQNLIIPGWEYIAPPKIEVIAKKATSTYKKAVPRTTTTAQQNYTSTWLYPLKWRKPYSGAYGNCTYYVASYKNVNWRWNANQWLYRARAAWNATWNYAKAWAIIVLGWAWYNPYYGHVGIVRSVEKDHLIISDMNYRAYNQVTVRKIARYGYHVKGYIYVWD